MNDPSPAQDGPDPVALESILFACLDAAPDAREAAFTAACRDHPALAEPLRRCWQRIRGLQPAATATPARIAGFRILQRLGGGGMGVVYLAEQERLHRKVALKLIRSDLVDSAAARERFQREAMAASKVEHPGLCPVFEVGEADGVPFLVMPYLEGVTMAARLAELAAQRPAKVGLSSAGRDLVAVMAAVARAAHHAHEHGLVHRDIKPGNLMLLADGRPVLLDFGLARDLASGEATLTKTSERLGTPAYMAPEQLRGERDAVDRRTDVYALGVVLYEVATLERAFVGDDLLALREQIASGVRPARLRGRVPYDLASIVLKAADPEPARRYATAAALADDLERFLRLEPVTARRLGSVGRAARWARRYPVIAGLLVALAVALGFATMALRSSVRDQRRSAAQALLGESRFDERTDVGVAVAKALEADVLHPTADSLMQLNRAVAARREVHRWALDAWLWWVAFSPDRRHVHAVTQAGSMHVFDVATRAEIQTLPPPQPELKVTFTVASADGEFVVFGGTGKQAYLWRPATGECKALAGAHEVKVQSAAISDDGRLVFTGDQRGEVARWSAMGELFAPFPWLSVSPERAANALPLELLCCGEMLMIGSTDRLVLAPIGRGAPIRLPIENFERPGQPQQVLLLSGAPEARRLFSARLGRHGVFDLEGALGHLPGATTRYFGGHMSRQGTRLAIGYRGFVRIYDLAQAGLGIAGVDTAPYREALVGDGPVVLVRFADDASRLFAAAENNVLRMFDGDGEALLSLPDFWKPVRSVDYDAATHTLLTGDEAGLVRLWDVRTCRSMPPEYQIPAGRYNGFATGCTDPLLVRRDSGRVVAFPVDGSAPWPLEVGDHILSDARVSRDGDLVALAARSGVASVWNLRERAGLLATPANQAIPPIGVDFLPGRRLLVVTSVNEREGLERRPCEVQVWRIDQKAREPEARFLCKDMGRLNHGAATPDGRHVVIGSFAEKAWVLPLDLEVSPPAFGEPRLIPVGHPVVHTDVARQGDRFVLTCADNSARIYGLGGGPPLHLVGHDKRVECAHFSPTGRWVVTASQDGTARIWDARTGACEVVVVVGAPSPVRDALFREDEQVLYTVSLDGVVRGWLLDRSELRALPMATSVR